MEGPHVTASNHSAKVLSISETFLKWIMDGSEVWLGSIALCIFMALVHTQLENI